VDGILEWGYDLISWTQQFSPELDTLFKVVTTLGAEQAFLLLLPVVFWCVDKRRGARLGALLMISAYLNYTLKILFDQPRPSSERVKVLAEETSPGLPSGHAQNSVTVYGYLAAGLRQPWAWLIASLIASAVGVSRIYLGVHFPSDVLGGWLIGTVVLLLYLWMEPSVEHWLHAWRWGYKMALATIMPLALFLVHADENTAQVIGVLIGMLAGVLIELRWVEFSAAGPLKQRALRFIIGSAILLVVWLGLKVTLPTKPETIALIFRLLRYVLVGGWASLGAPWLFVRVGLASRESEVQDDARLRPEPGLAAKTRSDPKINETTNQTR
jgi:membrane-associated phospholipid phosphatase